MPTPVRLPIEALIAPIPGATPAGTKIPPVEEAKIREFQKDVDPDREREALMRIEDETTRNLEIARLKDVKRKPAEWNKIIDFGDKYLRNTGKDLKMMIYMVEAITRLQGYAGVRDGLRLLHR
ncbi:MAG: type VI secretion system ImpA family N-terminal domain-containing protein, partial [Gemmataceae bacterium]